MAKQKTSGADPATVPEIVERDPELVLPSQWSPRYKCQVYKSVDYMDQIFTIGDHVMLHTGTGSDHKDLICVIDVLYQCPSRNAPMFKGRWFWTPQDVRENQSDRGNSMRVSRNEAQELICSDQRDSNLVEVISRKCFILNWPNFSKVQHMVSRAGRQCERIFFCDRMYYHKAFKVCELIPELFPGDRIPPVIITETDPILSKKLNVLIQSDIEKRPMSLDILAPKSKRLEADDDVIEVDLFVVEAYREEGTGSTTECAKIPERDNDGQTSVLQSHHGEASRYSRVDQTEN